MQFVRARCARCQLAFPVILRNGERTVQVDCGRWERACLGAGTCTEPRMCADLRRAAQALAGDERDEVRRPAR